MNMSQEDFEQIEKYLDGLLEGNSLELFRKRMDDDTSFYSVVQEQKLLRDAVQEEQLRDRLNDFHSSLESARDTATQRSGKVVLFRPWMRYAAVACVAILISWGGFTFLKESTNNNLNENEQLFASHFKPDPGLPTTMSTYSNYKFYEAMVDYKRGKYNIAISKWRKLRKDNTENDTLNYFLGVAYLAEGQPQMAISFLQNSTQIIESNFRSEAYYYLGLAHLKEGKNNEARTALEKSDQSESEELLIKLSNK